MALRLHFGDLADGSTLARLLRDLQPDEVYHLGAQSHVRVSFDMPEYTADVGAMGTIRLLEAIRETGVRDALLPGVLVGDVRRRRRRPSPRPLRSSRARPTRRRR